MRDGNNALSISRTVLAMNEQAHDLTIPTDVVLDSRTIELNRYFDERGANPQLLVLIEDAEDKCFWQKVFSCVSDKYSSIDVWPLQESADSGHEQHDATGNILTATGKDALMRVEGLGCNKMIAVDADYDLFIENLHSYTDKLQGNEPFIQHTIYHSIENHLLDDDRFTARPEIQTFCEKLEDYQYCLIGELVHHGNELKQGRLYNLALTIDDVRSCLGSLQYHQDSYATDIDMLLSADLSYVAPTSSVGYSRAKSLCVSNHIDKQNIWQIIQGHTLYEYVEKIVTFEMVRHRKSLESTITTDVLIPRDQILQKISELKRSLLGRFHDEKEKFRNDVYSGVYLNMAKPAIIAIQQKILKEVGD